MIVAVVNFDLPAPLTTEEARANFVDPSSISVG
ncbi:MAG: hypothetical protein QOH53_1732 [Ilumatobacteraceae bacterium]